MEHIQLAMIRNESTIREFEVSCNKPKNFFILKKYKLIAKQTSLYPFAYIVTPPSKWNVYFS